MRATIADLKPGQIVYTATCGFACVPVETYVSSYVVIYAAGVPLLVAANGPSIDAPLIATAHTKAPLWTSIKEARLSAVDEAKIRCQTDRNNNIRWLAELDKYRTGQKEAV
jgi:hypothetical protein